MEDGILNFGGSMNNVCVCECTLMKRGMMMKMMYE